MFCSSPCLKALLSLIPHGKLKCPTCKDPFKPFEIFSVDPEGEGRERSVELLSEALLGMEERGGAALGVSSSSSSGSTGSSSSSSSGSRGCSQQLPSGVPSTERVNAITLPDSLAKNVGSKVATLLRRLVCLAEEEDKAIVVSSSPNCLYSVQAGCRVLGIPCSLLAGSASARADTVALFSSSAAAASSSSSSFGGRPLRVLLLSTFADCAGLTLTAANHLYLMDQVLHLNTLMQLQARLARLGQTKSVYIYHLCTFPVDAAMLLQRHRGAAPLCATEDSPSPLASAPATVIDNQVLSPEAALSLLRYSTSAF